jgi:hypothetical protein
LEARAGFGLVLLGKLFELPQQVLQDRKEFKVQLVLKEFKDQPGLKELLDQLDPCPMLQALSDLPVHKELLDQLDLKVWREIKVLAVLPGRPELILKFLVLKGRLDLADRLALLAL